VQLGQATKKLQRFVRHLVIEQAEILQCSQAEDLVADFVFHILTQADLKACQGGEST
jgi:hypothetical protein